MNIQEANKVCCAFLAYCNSPVNQVYQTKTSPRFLMNNRTKIVIITNTSSLMGLFLHLLPTILYPFQIVLYGTCVHCMWNAVLDRLGINQIRGKLSLQRAFCCKLFPFITGYTTEKCYA